MPTSKNNPAIDKKVSYYCSGCNQKMFGDTGMQFTCQRCNQLFQVLPTTKREVIEYMNKQHALIKELKDEISDLTTALYGLGQHHEF